LENHILPKFNEYIRDIGQFSDNLLRYANTVTESVQAQNRISQISNSLKAIPNNINYNTFVNHLSNIVRTSGIPLNLTYLREKIIEVEFYSKIDPEFFN